VNKKAELEQKRDALDRSLTANRDAINALKICVETSLDDSREELDRLTNERARLMQEWNFVLGELAAMTPIAEFSRAS
jgi:predicted  nucleic acid-binding Zn-ribbon protein